MYTFLIVIHLLVCFTMVGVILLQAGKGAEIGAAFGGASQTIFGSRGPGTFLSKVTVGGAVIFMFTSLSLAVLSKERSVFSLTDTGVQGGAEMPVEMTPALEETPSEGEHQNMAPGEESANFPEETQK